MVDTSPFANVDAANEPLLVLREKDANAAFNPQATHLVEDLCRKNDLSFVYKDRYVDAENKKLVSAGESPRSLGSTEMGRIIAASNGLVDGTTIQIPTSGYHTMEESASWESVDAFIRLLTDLSDGV